MPRAIQLKSSQQTNYNYRKIFLCTVLICIATKGREIVGLILEGNSIHKYKISLGRQHMLLNNEEKFRSHKFSGGSHNNHIIPMYPV